MKQISTKFFRYSSIVLFLFVLVYLGLTLVTDEQELTVPYSILGVCVFHAIASVLTYGIVVAVFKYLPSQAGYAYLAAVFIKLGLFVLVFQSAVFSEEALSFSQRLPLVIPFILFLFTEIYALFKLLNESNAPNDLKKDV